MDDDGIADRDLAGHDREPVRDARQHRDAGALQARLEPVEHLREEGIAGPDQPKHLDRGVEAGAELLRARRGVAA